MQTDKILYFTYGSNMSKYDLDRWCIEKGYKEIKIYSKLKAVLHGYELSFNYYSTSRKAGAANIMENPIEYVIGLLYELDHEGFIKIAEKEGSPNYYSEIKIKIKVDGEQLDNISTFKVIKAREKSTFQRPTKHYMSLIISAAEENNFDKAYIDKLKSVSTV